MDSLSLSLSTCRFLPHPDLTLRSSLALGFAVEPRRGCMASNAAMFSSYKARKEGMQAVRIDLAREGGPGEGESVDVGRGR